jgi:cytochrome c oxidase subunit 3
MEAVSTQRNRIHPHKFTLWVAIGSIIMMFAGLTSAYIVKRDQPNWLSFEMPRVFWYSTRAILLSSFSIQIALRKFKEREMRSYRTLMMVTMVLGLMFVGGQFAGFRELWNKGVSFRGSSAGQFLYVIAGLHAVHVLGGVIVLVIQWIKSQRKLVRNYSSTPVEIAATYWHFVDLLWIYLFVFFLWIQ